MNIEAENLDSLRKLVRELQAENIVLKEIFEEIIWVLKFPLQKGEIVLY